MLSHTRLEALTKVGLELNNGGLTGTLIQKVR
jgi:hypothetical protein